MDIQRELDTLLQLIASVTDAFTAGFFIANTSRTSLRLTAWHSLSRNLDAHRQVPVDDSFLGVIYKYGKTYDISKMERDLSGLIYYSQREDIKAFIGVPVSDQGILIVDSKRAFGFNDRDKKLLGMFANQIERTIQNYRTQMYAEEKAGYFDLIIAFNHILSEGYDIGSILRQTLYLLTSRLNADCGLIAQVDPDSRSYRLSYSTLPEMDLSSYGPRSFDDGLLGLIAKRGTPLMLNNIRAAGERTFAFDPQEGLGFQSLLAFPITANAQVRVILALFSSQQEYFSPLDQATMQLLTNYLVIAREYRSLKRRFDELDPVTKLANEKFFLRAYSNLIRQDSDLQVIYIELLRIEKLIKKFGFHTIEKLLRIFASWVQDIIGSELTLAAFRPGQFGLLLTGDYAHSDRGRSLQRIQDLVDRKSIRVENQEFPVNFRMVQIHASTNLRAEDLIDYARRRLHASQL